MKAFLRILLAFIAVLLLYFGYFLHYALLIAVGGIVAIVLVVWLILENNEYEEQLKNK